MMIKLTALALVAILTIFSLSLIFIPEAAEADAGIGVKGEGFWGDDDDDSGSGPGSDFGLGDVDVKGLVYDDPIVITANIIKWALGMIGSVLVLIIIYGGIIYMTASGNEQRIEKAKTILTYGIIGAVIAFSAWMITDFVISVIRSSSSIIF